MKLQEFTELLTKPLMIKVETTEIACASVAHRQKTYIWIDARLLYGFEHSNLTYRICVGRSRCPYPMRRPHGNPSMRHKGMLA